MILINKWLEILYFLLYLQRFSKSDVVKIFFCSHIANKAAIILILPLLLCRFLRMRILIFKSLTIISVKFHIHIHIAVENKWHVKHWEMFK